MIVALLLESTRVMATSKGRASAPRPPLHPWRDSFAKMRRFHELLQHLQDIAAIDTESSSSCVSIPRMLSQRLVKHRLSQGLLSFLHTNSADADNGDDAQRFPWILKPRIGLHR